MSDSTTTDTQLILAQTDDRTLYLNDDASGFSVNGSVIELPEASGTVLLSTQVAPSDTTAGNAASADKAAEVKSEHGDKTVSITSDESGIDFSVFDSKVGLSGGFVSRLNIDNSAILTETVADGKYGKVCTYEDLASNVLSAESGKFYSLTMTSEQSSDGLRVTLPPKSASGAGPTSGVQGFAIRVDASQGATQIAELIPSSATERLSFDWPDGMLMGKGSVSEGVHYIAFARISASRWSVRHFAVSDLTETSAS